MKNTISGNYQKKAGAGTHILYCDLDNDGNSERIHLFKNFTGKVGIIVYQNDRLLDQWNFDKDFRGAPSFRDGLTFVDLKTPEKPPSKKLTSNCR